MQIAIKVVVALFAVLFVVLGSGVMLDPSSAPAQFGVELLGLVGSSTLRGDLGGMFLGAAVMLASAATVPVSMARIASGRAAANRASSLGASDTDG